MDIILFQELMGRVKMNYTRNLIERYFKEYRDKLFEQTKDDPEIAHEKFVRTSRIIDKLGLSKFLFDNDSNYELGDCELSNAAGFNKNGTIPPRFLYYLGFDRVVVGTVTHDVYGGNPRPRIMRFPETESMVNWMGLPGVGSSQVARNLEYFEKYYPSPLITINLMSTPGKSGKDVLKDLEGTLKDTIDLPNVDRFELNISCPNTHCGLGTDARQEYQDNLKSMLDVVRSNVGHRAIDLKVSPDLDEFGVDSIIESSKEYDVDCFTTTNTTTEHDMEYISPSPGKGGASGEAV